jgi:lipopolysaccharide biosynthesis glycosyltransferase
MKSIVVYATDENYVKLTAVSMYSLLAHNPGTDIAILADNLSDNARGTLFSIAQKFGVPLRFVDVKHELQRIKAAGAESYVSFSAYSRLFIAKVLKNDFDRAIYLDSDTLTAGNLQPLSELDLHGQPFAIGYDCLHNNYKKLIGVHPLAPYFNSGVLVINPREWENRRCTERILDYMTQVRHDLMFGDQDYFSLVLADDAAILPPQYNFLTHFQMFRTRNDVLRATGIPASAWYTEEQYAAAREKPVIHHFLGHTLGRPWYRESLNPLRPLYRQIAAEAGLPEVAEQSRPIDLCYKVQYLAWKTLPAALFPWICRAMYAYYFRTRYKV